MGNIRVKRSDSAHATQPSFIGYPQEGSVLNATIPFLQLFVAAAIGGNVTLERTYLC